VEKAGFFFLEEINYSLEELCGKDLDSTQTRQILEKALDVFSNLAQFNKKYAEPPMREYVETSGLSAGQVFGVLRVAVTGQKVSPPLFESMEIIGKDKVLERLRLAITKLG